MPVFESGELELNFEETGNGIPVIMLHGFGMSAKTCWIDTGWFHTLKDNGFRALALDGRGHGLSDKPVEAAEYAADLMTGDVIHLLDHLRIERAHFIGHSMGARTAFDIALNHPDRLASLIGISIGANLFEHIQSGMFIKALERTDPASVPPGLTHFAEMLLSVGNELEPLIACLSSPRPIPHPSDLGAMDKPVLLACGQNDAIVGDPTKVASALPRANAIAIPNREHTDVLGCAELQQAAMRFLRAL